MGTFEYKNGEQKKQIWIEPYCVSFDLEPNDYFEIKWEDDNSIKIYEESDSFLGLDSEIYEGVYYFINGVDVSKGQNGDR